MGPRVLKARPSFEGSAERGMDPKFSTTLFQRFGRREIEPRTVHDLLTKIWQKG
jgi:hypothetical protein